MTARELVAASLRLIGVKAAGESLEASEATDGLAALNRLLGSWSTEGLLVHARTRDSFTLTSGDGSYTFGSSGDLNSTRPTEILEAFIRDESVSPAIDYPPLKMLSLEEWSRVSQKESEGGIPRNLYDDGGYPLRTLYLHPEPTGSKKLVVHSRKPLTELATIDTSVSLPPGYDRALVYNLALDLSPEYGKTPPDSVVLIAQETKGNLKNRNHSAPVLRCDSALLPSGGFDMDTGESR